MNEQMELRKRRREEACQVVTQAMNAELVLEWTGEGLTYSPDWNITEPIYRGLMEYSAEIERIIKPMPRRWHTYFIQCATTGLVKIGKSTNVTDRFKQIQAMCPTKLVALGVTWMDEARIHDCFTEERRHGEWFQVSDRLAMYIEDTFGCDALSLAI